MRKNGIIKNNNSNKSSKWNFDNVKNILLNEIYIGNMVQGKKRCFEINSSKRTNRDEWIIVENTHEPIISKEGFYEVQKINQRATDKYNSVNKLKKDKIENIFKGLLKCGDCGKKLVIGDSIERYKSGTTTYRFFKCNYNKVYGCMFHLINEVYLKEIVFEELKKQIQRANNLKDIILRNSDIIYFEEENLSKNIENINTEIQRIQNFYKLIYEDYAIGLLDKDTYIFTKNKYLEKERDALKEKNRLEKRLLSLKENLSIDNKFLNRFLKFKDSKVLTRELLEALIKEIVIYGDKTICITFNYMDDSNILIDELITLKVHIA